MARRGSGAAALVFVISAAAAQNTIVVPPGAAKRPGNSATPYFSGYGSGRVQQIVAGRAVAAAVATIQAIALRADGSSALPSRSFQSMKLSLGYTSKTPATMVKTFASNRTGSQTLVFSGAYSLPAQAAGARPFNIVWKFARPFVYLPARGNLLIEWEVPGRPSKSQYFLDAEIVPAGGGTSWAFGSSGAFKSPETYTVSCPDLAKLKPGGAAAFLAGPFKLNRPALVLYGVSASSFGPFRLPLDLSPLGAPGNRLYVSADLALPLPMKAGTGGWFGRTALPLPADPTLTGFSLYAQGVFADARSKALGLVFSPGLRFILGGSYAIHQLLGHYDSTATSGFFLRSGEGLVIQFGGLFR